jgi:formamidopyrimidine-DNA glycosylase
VPELPEVEALTAFLRENAVGSVGDPRRPASVQAIKTFDPPLSALGGLEVTGASRHGKFLDLDVSGLQLVVHLARGGGCTGEPGCRRAAQAGKGPLALRATSRTAKASTSPSRAPARAWPSTSSARRGGARHRPARPGRARGRRETFAALGAGRGSQGRLTDQTRCRASETRTPDEILHAVRLSPFKMADKLTEAELVRLFDAVHAVLTARWHASWVNGRRR